MLRLLYIIFFINNLVPLFIVLQENMVLNINNRNINIPCILCYLRFCQIVVGEKSTKIMKMVFFEKHNKDGARKEKSIVFSCFFYLQFFYV